MSSDKQSLGDCQQAVEKRVLKKNFS